MHLLTLPIRVVRLDGAELAALDALGNQGGDDLAVAAEVVAVDADRNEPAVLVEGDNLRRASRYRSATAGMICSLKTVSGVNSETLGMLKIAWCTPRAASCLQ